MSDHSDNQKKLSGFFAREYHNLLSFVKSYWTGDAEADAEDIVQDVMLSLYTKVDFNRPIENLLAYTYRSLKNRVIDRQRKRKDQVLSTWDDEESGENSLLRLLASEEVSKEEAEETEENIEKMFELIEELRPDQQEILIMTEIEGYTFEELSKEWAVPIGTLLSRKHRAMAKLQKLMAQQKNKY
ncbi:MAG: RNA polymerase sigma factor [Bacteroidales bacterium]|nr:RNA polymerase sigma factor [Bacteroidales bacterium]MCF8405136.1 RNA polymerase sigma factor [Bacteroidales bacterium]